MKPKTIYLAIRKRILLLLRGQYFVARRNGRRYLIDPYNYIDRRIEAFGTYERSQRSYFLNLLKQNAATLFVDIGANNGLYSIDVLHTLPDIKAVAFEPDTRNLAQLYANLFLNEIEDRVEIHNVALSNTVGSVRFHRHERENRGRSMIAADGERSVAVAMLDDIITCAGQTVGIKIDVEGHELKVLDGAKKLLVNNKCILQVEAFNPKPVLELLREYGYRTCAQFGDDYILQNFL